MRSLDQDGLQPYQHKCPGCGTISVLCSEPTMKLLTKIIEERDELIKAVMNTHLTKEEAGALIWKINMAKNELDRGN